ncbi:MAG: WD40 repeat domain-containing protein, partial [Planctomycetota bacterium]
VENGVGSVHWADSDHLVISARGTVGIQTQKWQLPQHLSFELKGDGTLAGLIKRNGKVFVSTSGKSDPGDDKTVSINANFNREGRPTGLKSQISFGSAVPHFSLSDDGLNAFVVHGNDEVSTVARYSFPSMKLNSVPVKLEYTPRTIDFERHGKYWATSDIQNNIVVRSFDDGKVLFKTLLPNWVKDVGVTDDGRVVSTCWDGKLRIWNFEGSLIDEFNHASLPDMMKFHGSQMIVAHGKEYSLYQFDNGRWQFQKSVTHGLGRIEVIEFSRDDSRFVTCGDNGQTSLWTKDAQFVASLGKAGPVSDVRFSEKHQWVATLGEAGGINLWDAKTGKPMSATVFGLQKIDKIEWSEESLYFGGQTDDNYWLQKITLPESWQR